jgi:FkbM family methyltransferase
MKPAPPVIMQRLLVRVIYRLLGLAPAPIVERLRRAPRLALVVDRVVSVVSRPLQGKTVTIRSGEAAGLLFRVPRSSTVWISGKVETPVQVALRRALRPGDVFFDVGANVGFFTILGARLVGPSGKVVAFEPHPANVEALRANVEANAFENVVVVPNAVTASSGERLLDIRSATLAKLVEDRSEPGAAELVPATSIDDFVSTHADLIPDVLKIDVEGHEVEVLSGMRGTLTQHSPVIVCEMHGLNESFRRALAEFGYTFEVLDRAGTVDEAPPWAHVLACPPRHDAGAGSESGTILRPS